MLLILSMAEIGPYQLVLDRIGGSGDTPPSESNGNYLDLKNSVGGIG